MPSAKQLIKKLVPRTLIESVSDGARFIHELETNLFLSLPNATKQAFVTNAARLLKYPVFIETGTFEGEMVAAQSEFFRELHTIELDSALATRAELRFKGSNVRTHQGDSGIILREILQGLTSSTVFWLDAHYSGGETARGSLDTPVMAELSAIKAHKVRPHAILIDDARVFGTDASYPTLEEVISLLREIDSGFRIGVSSDIIWASPVKLLDFQWRESDDGSAVQPSTTGV